LPKKFLLGDAVTSPASTALVVDRSRDTNSRIFKANSSWSTTWAKFRQLIASLSVVLPQLNLTKLKLEYLKFGF